MVSEGHAEQAAALPFVSVVVPTKNRAAMLRDCIAGLCEQTYPRNRFEVVFVNDGSTDETAALLNDLAATAPFAVRIMTTVGIGAPAARNLGMRAGCGEIVAHLDDDCRPAPTWLAEGVRGFGPRVAIVGGPVFVKPGQVIPYLSFAMEYLKNDGGYPTANIFYRRELALAAGGFDESFSINPGGRPAYGWDSDLAWRLLRQGYQSRFLPDVVAYQEVFPQSALEWVRYGWRARSIPYAVKRVPELRRTALFWRVFTNRFTLTFDVGVLGVLLALILRRRWPVFLAVPWFVWAAPQHSIHDVWPPSRWPKLGVKVSLMTARYAVHLAGLLVGSVKERRLVL
jgi:glycosyltransferase involved in cell wall biosynthesis